MSAAHSNTQQSLSHTRGGKFSRGGNTRSSSSLEEAPEFKILRTKYSSGLKTLNEMFPDWTDADLLSALKEADGNLEITIARIAEGHTTQWGEVKSRKEKRQATKQHEDTKSSEKASYVPRPASFRGGVRGGAARGGRGGYSGAASSTRGAKPASVANKTSASAAAATSSDAASSGWDVDRKSESKSSAGAWGAKSSSGAQESKSKEPSQQVSSSGSAAPAKPAPMSWASIAKRGVKQTSPEPAPASQSDKKSSEASPTHEDEAASKKESADATSSQENPEASSSLETSAPEAATEDKPETVIVEETVTVVEVENVTEPTQPEEAAPTTLEAEAAVLEASVPESQTAPASAKKPAASARRLNQDAPVVMPTGSSSLERIGMQFGSLSIGGVELSSLAPAAAVASEIEKPAAEAAAAAPAQPEVKEAAVPAQAAVPEAAPAVPVSVPAAAATAAAPVSAAPAAAPAAASAAAEPAAQTTSVPQGPLTTYLQQQQQNITNQSPAYPSASAISQMPLPNDYGAAALYGAEPPRNLMGFYDSYGYGQFVANKDASAAATSADSQAATTSGPQAAGINGTNNLGQAGLFPQQMPQPFGMNHGMPWPQSYYFGMMQPGSQFHNPAAYGNNPALAAAYGQPFMKQQGMYMMYPGATPQGLQGAASQQQQQQQVHQQQQQQQGVQQSGQQTAQGQQQQAGQQAAAGNQQVNAQQAGVKNPAQSSAGNPYGNINAQKAGNPYGHYAANIGAGFGVYEQDPAALSNSPQQFSLGGMPGIFSASKGGAKDPNAKGNPPSGTAPVIGGTTYYSTPQQLGGYPSQVSSTHPQGFSSHHQQPYYASYAPSYGQTQTPHMYQQQQPQHHHHHHHHQQQQHQQPQGGHQQANKQYWEKQ